jgi:hypothetical protein
MLLHTTLPRPRASLSPRSAPRRPRVATAAAPAPWTAAADLCAPTAPHRCRARCSAAVSSWRALDSGEEALGSGGAAAAVGAPAHLLPAYGGPSPAATKFDRILRFVEQHDLGGAATAPAAAEPWHVSYDEEAEEGCGPDAAAVPDHEAAQLAHAAATLAAAAPAFPSCSVAFLYPGEAAATAPGGASAAPGAVGSLAYFMAKPWDASYDEEAEGCYEAAAAAAAAARAARLAQFNERRAESRAAARARRAALTRSLGDLEGMAAWVSEEDASMAALRAVEAAKTAVGRMQTSRYPHLTAFLAARGGAMGVIEALQRERGLQARRPQQWQYTWDEEVFDEGGVALSSM